MITSKYEHSVKISISILKGSSTRSSFFLPFWNKGIKSTVCSQLVFQLLMPPIQSREASLLYKSIPVPKSEVNLSTENVYTALAA